MNVGDTVYNIAVSRDGRWIVSGTESGMVQAWNTKNGGKLAKFTAPFNWVEAVDVSPDSTKIVHRSNDKTVCIWSFPTGQKLHEPWRLTKYHFWIQDWYDQSNPTISESPESPEPPEPPGTDWNHWKCRNPQFRTWQSPYRHYYTIHSTLFHSFPLRYECAFTT